jgi:beta-lactamase superfamily II metal-dependent hydrolase
MAFKITSKPIVIGAAATVLAFGMAGYVWREEHREPILELYVFNLKSGSSVFVRTPDDKRILINGGANSEVIRELTDILPFYSRRIDTIIATAADGKDVSGLIDVLERYSVDNVVVPAITLQSLGLASTTDQIYATFLDTVSRLKIPLREVSAGDALDLGHGIGEQGMTGQDVRAEILFPASSAASSTDAHANSGAFQYSRASAPEIIMRISYGQTSFMLLGNATTKVQKFIATSTESMTGGDLRTNVLVVPHSVSADSLSAALMNKIKPDYLIYSQAITSSSKKSTKKPTKVDPLYFILGDKRFNLKDKGTAKIVSDGMTLKVIDK